MMLDEVIDSPQRFAQAVQDQAINVACIKSSNVGGIEATRQIMVLAKTFGIPLRIEDYYGTGILQACLAHLAHTMPRRLVFGLFDYVSDKLPLVKNPLTVSDGRIGLPSDCGNGLGVVVNEELLGRPVSDLSFS
jgi:L-alanine-DL-glutamate epimerase-like enolase superfamily enzyme